MKEGVNERASYRMKEGESERVSYRMKGGESENRGGRDAVRERGRGSDQT